MAKMPAVFLVKPGSIERDEYGRILDARSSVTLIIRGQHTIIVDSGLCGEEELILGELAKLGIEQEDVKSIINTHSDADHCGNNYLFSRAKTLKAKEGEVIAPGVWVMETPGHSMDSISVVVETDDGASQSKTVVISGDALPTFGNFIKNVPPALHVDRDNAIASMQRIIALSDIVVPGHDFPFSIRRREYLSLPFKM
ncbi:MAG: MBL fold metallo-hydrolase [Methanothrix sp.]|nr:MBL fold metallo-hydrolase [Methanothrix sp.]MDD4447528.1 MBL fold metallo-hydrolase [Methanothrix sp.]